MNATKMSLDGKAVLVTGGSLGIGRAIALTFADAGADIAIAGRTLTNLQSVVNEIKSIGRRGLPVVSNIAEIQESKVLAERVLTEFGRIDILVNNAGANPWRGPLTKIEEWAWDAMFNLNLKGLFFLSQFVAGIMKKQGGGNIINIASVSGIKPRANASSNIFSGI